MDAMRAFLQQHACRGCAHTPLLADLIMCLQHVVTEHRLCRQCKAHKDGHFSYFWGKCWSRRSMPAPCCHLTDPSPDMTCWSLQTYCRGMASSSPAGWCYLSAVAYCCNPAGKLTCHSSRCTAPSRCVQVAHCFMCTLLDSHHHSGSCTVLLVSLCTPSRLSHHQCWLPCPCTLLLAVPFANLIVSHTAASEGEIRELLQPLST